MDLMSDARRIAKELKAAGIEMQACCNRIDDRAATRAHAEYLASAFHHDEGAAVNLRNSWHDLDMRADDGIFFEAVSETVHSYHAELYPLMLRAPHEFGIRLAGLVNEYADRIARHQAS